MKKLIIRTEESLEVNQAELVRLSSSGQSSELVDLYKEVAIQESLIEESFEALEVAQHEFDDIME